MPHGGSHGCPKCIIDCGRLIAAARLVGSAFPNLQAAATYLADVVTFDMRGIENGADQIPPERYEEVRAWSELDCHRAAELERWIAETDWQAASDGVDTLMRWAREHRLFATGLFGGEYDGPYTIDVINGISKQA